MIHLNKGTCSRSVNFDIIDGKVHNVEFLGGCSGNTQAISALIEGMDAEDAIERIINVKCGMRNTSCPAQLAEGIREALASDKSSKGDSDNE